MESMEELQIRNEKQEKRIETLLENLKILEKVIENPYAYETLRHEHQIKSYKDTLKRDTHPIGNILVNMGGMDFCEALQLNENKGCEKYHSCTECIDAYLKEYYTKQK